jgi:hypothetical protein
LIQIQKKGALVVEKEVRASVTSGRTSNLALEKATDRFIAVSYDAGEFCNGVIVFDITHKKIAAELGCVTQSDVCHITELKDDKCQAKVTCNQVATEDPPTRKEPLLKTLTLCRS